jgi:monoterpene epsilon-lactone hydrolase
MFRLILAMLGGIIAGTFRRLSRGPTQPSWSYLFDVMISGQRALLGHMSTLSGAALRKVSAGGMAASKEVAALGFDRVSEPVRGAWIRPNGGAGAGTLLFLHGGGYVVGSIESHHEFAGRLAMASGLDVFTLDYRLAPEHPHPAAVEDAAAAWHWLLEQGHAPEHMVVAGDSAGGGLTAALLLKLREQGAPLPAAAGLVCPWVDLTLSHPSIEGNLASDMLSRGPLEIWSRDYSGGADPASPLISPLNADLAGLPPMLVQVGDAEVLRDEGVAFASKAEKAGVDVQLSRWPEMPHDWHMMANMDPRGGEAITELGEYLGGRVGENA